MSKTKTGSEDPNPSINACIKSEVENWSGLCFFVLVTFLCQEFSVTLQRMQAFSVLSCAVASDRFS
jgi:hypothetical protein